MDVKKPIYVDVTNTIHAHFTTGIQRVTKELLVQFKRLNAPVIPMVHCRFLKRWRGLTSPEKQIIYQKKLPPASIIRQGIRTVRLLLTLAWRQVRAVKFNLQPNSLFLDLDAGWHNQPPRKDLLPSLKSQSVTPVQVHYDLIPINMSEVVHPMTVQRYSSYILAHLDHTRHYICISENSKSQLGMYFEAQRPSIDPQIEAFHLGCEIKTVSRSTRTRIQNLQKYLLIVGTLEPRKNHVLLLNTFEELHAVDPTLELVITGKKGWLADDVIQNIYKLQAKEFPIHWFSQLADSDLQYLYQHTFLTIVPSLFEGYGLPVVEALQCGSVVISSNRGALPEAGQDYVDYFDPEDEEAFVKLVRRYLEDQAYYDQKKDQVKSYRGTTWEASAAEFLSILEKFNL